MTRYKLQHLAGAGLFALSALAFAGPTSPDGADDDAAGRPQQAAEALMHSDGQASSKTIQMLLELQKSTPGTASVDAASPGRAEIPASRRPAAVAAAPFGQATAPAVKAPTGPQGIAFQNTQGPGSDWAESAVRPRAGLDPQVSDTTERNRSSGTRQASSEDAARNGGLVALMPWLSDLLVLLREHRAAVLIGSLAVVGALAFGAARSGQKHS